MQEFNVDLKAECDQLNLAHETTLWVRKNWATIIFTVTLANVGRFLKFFRCHNQKEMTHKMKNFSP